MFLQPPPPPVMVRGSDSFQDMEEVLQPEGTALHTPLPHEARRGFPAPSASCSTGTSGESSLSSAATCDKALRQIQLGTELDSPAIRKGEGGNFVAASPRVPSCPHKEVAKVHKRHGVSAPHQEDNEEIRPRALDMSDAADPVNGLSLSPMCVSTASPAWAANHKGGRGSRLAPPDMMADARPKRQRFSVDGVPPFDAMDMGASGSWGAPQAPPLQRAGSSFGAPPPAPVKHHAHAFTDDSEPLPMSSSFAVPAPPPLQHHNSMADTKMLFARKDRHGSFSAPAGSEMAFQYEDHFDWLCKLGSGSFSDVYAVRNKRSGEHFAVKRSKREFRSKRERAE